MCAGVRRGFTICLIVTGALCTSRAHAAAPSTQPIEGQFVAPNLTAPTTLNLDSPTLRIDGIDEPPVTSAKPAATQPAPIEAISDPLPPAFWSGVVMLALAAGLLSMRQVRRLLR